MLRSAEPTIQAEHLDQIDRLADRIEPDDPAIAGWYHHYHREHARRLAGDVALVSRLAAPPARLLDCGSVPLLATAALASRGYRISGVDIAPARFAGAIRSLRLDVRQCDIECEPLPFADGTFDGVLFSELFEHLRINPIATMREVRRVLRAGGRLVLSTPNLRSFRGARNLLLRDRGHAVSPGGLRQYEKLETIGHMGHVREYTLTEVVELLDHVGLRVDEVIYRGGHGKGLVGLAERLFPAWRPFFTLVAVRPAEDGQ